MKAVRPYVGEHDDEAAPGLPAPLPANERLLWRGSPDAWLLARRGFHFNKFALYFGVLIAWRLISTLADGGTLGLALATTLWTVPLAALTLGFIALLAGMVARTTIYTLTDRRLVMRVGIVLTVTFNLPLRRIETARLHALGGEAGDIALVLNPQDRIGYLHLWPHARPWRFARTEPMLRALPQAGVITPRTQKVISSLSDVLRCSGHVQSLTYDARSNMFVSNVAIQRRREGPTLERCIRFAPPRSRCRAGRGDADRRVWLVAAPGLPLPAGSTGDRASGARRHAERGHDHQGARGHRGEAALARAGHRFDDRRCRLTRRLGLAESGAPGCLSAARAAKSTSSIALTVCSAPSSNRSTTSWFPIAPAAPVGARE